MDSKAKELAEAAMPNMSLRQLCLEYQQRWQQPPGTWGRQEWMNVILREFDRRDGFGELESET